LDKTKVDAITNKNETSYFRAFLGRKSTTNPFLSYFSVKIDGAIAPKVEHKCTDDSLFKTHQGPKSRD
jgi:hypothetical protein